MNIMTKDLAAPPLTITPTAAKHLAAFVGKYGGQVRLEIKAGGCSGYSIRFSQSEPQDGDLRFGPDGAELLIDESSLGLIPGATIDYVEQIGREGFVIEKIANVESRCGCGKSFATKE